MSIYEYDQEKHPNGEAGGLGEDQDRVQELAEKPTQ